jgi:hypothetical protein
VRRQRTGLTRTTTPWQRSSAALHWSYDASLKNIASAAHPLARSASQMGSVSRR